MSCMGSIPGKARTDKNVNVYLEMQCKSLWIKASAKCINVNVKIDIKFRCSLQQHSNSCSTANLLRPLKHRIFLMESVWLSSVLYSSTLYIHCLQVTKGTQVLEKKKNYVDDCDYNPEGT